MYITHFFCFFVDRLHKNKPLKKEKSPLKLPSRELFSVSYLILIKTRGEPDEKVVVVGLISLHSRLVAHHRAAFFATVKDNEALFGVGKGLNGAKNSQAIVCSVPGIYVNMKRAKAEGAVVARGVSQGSDLSSAIYADKSLVVFCKTLVFHITVLCFSGFSLFSYAEF